jgi:D-psicose/D-tagatose/L-ribulose 3-epimerase
MKLSISNIAWNSEDNQGIAALLKSKNISAIDGAPGKFFEDLNFVSKIETQSVKSFWNSRGFKIVGMQSLLYGTTGLNLFGNNETQDKMLAHLERVAELGSWLGLKYLTFGSPKNRDRSEIADAKVMPIAVAFFQKLGIIAKKHSVVFCIEPNPTRYNCNFLTTTADTIEAIQMVGSDFIKLQLDLGAVSENSENLEDILKYFSHLIAHIHISEPGLVPIGDASFDHAHYGNLLNQYLPHKTATIEMVATEQEPPQESVLRAIDFTIKHYD